MDVAPNAADSALSSATAEIATADTASADIATDDLGIPPPQARAERPARRCYDATKLYKVLDGCIVEADATVADPDAPAYDTPPVWINSNNFLFDTGRRFRFLPPTLVEVPNPELGERTNNDEDHYYQGHWTSIKTSKVDGNDTLLVGTYPLVLDPASRHCHSLTWEAAGAQVVVEAGPQGTNVKCVRVPHAAFHGDVADPPTLGQKRVRAAACQAGSQARRLVIMIANVLDELQAMKARDKDGEYQRVVALAQTELESAAHWAAKAATWEHPESAAK